MRTKFYEGIGRRSGKTYRAARIRAILLFRQLVEQGRQVAEIEQRSYAICRDEEAGYTLRALDELTSYRERKTIVKKLRFPKPQAVNPKHHQERMSNVTRTERDQEA